MTARPARTLSDPSILPVDARKECLRCGVNIAYPKRKWCSSACKVRNWQEEHRDQLNAHYREVYYPTNRDRAIESTRRWQRENPDRVEEHGRQRGERRKQQRAEARPVLFCQWCDKRLPGRKLKWCNRECQYAANRERILARQRELGQRQRWEAANPEKRRELNRRMARRRRARLRNQRTESYNDADIFERDGWVCWLCDAAVDPALSHPDPFSATIDHVVLIAAGGADAPDNVRLAHRQCNMRRPRK